MGVRQRIVAIALFGVQLLQGMLPAAGAACERETTAATTAAIAATAPDVPSVHHHHRAPADPSSGTPTSEPVQHPHAPASCPMAMACTISGVLSSTVAVSTVDVDVDVHRSVHVAEWPVSLDIAPEPRPPRG
ncbi:hypothetical protein [Gemmatimonas sp.]|uniref:hypothetical protein n=1 Tax=Gemmatimonas sp. TaxID=1962908 RepID=UPI003982E881